MSNRIINRPKSARLKNYDYSRPGGYAVTLVTAMRECLFGKIIDGRMVLSELGIIVETEWRRSSEIRKELTIDEFIVMPNHLHGIVMIQDVSHCRAGVLPKSG